GFKYYYGNTVAYTNQEPMQERWTDSATTLYHLYQDVTKSLLTQGPLSQEKTGWWIFASPLEPKIKEKFAHLEENLRVMEGVARFTRDNGADTQVAGPDFRWNQR